MENKKQTKTDIKKVEVKTEAKEILTIATVFKKLATQGTKDRETLAVNIIKYLADKGVAKNVRGHDIKKERVLQQISAMLRDIKMERGKEKKSWWSMYTIVEDKTEGKEVIKIVPK